MMLKKPTIAILALVMIVVVGVAIYAGTAQVEPKNQSDIINNTVLTNTDNNISQVKVNNSENIQVKTMISASEAKSIAEKYIEEPNATAGTPRLVEIEGQMIYVVPVMMNGENVGQIEIDAYTGENVGGAGGVS
ncbi:MAG: PepSY domain-containing protein [Methanothermobacter sp.]